MFHILMCYKFLLFIGLQITSSKLREDCKNCRIHSHRFNPFVRIIYACINLFTSQGNLWSSLCFRCHLRERVDVGINATTGMWTITSFKLFSTLLLFCCVYFLCDDEFFSIFILLSAVWELTFYEREKLESFWIFLLTTMKNWNWL